jgi:hypothetical protein
MPRDQIEQNEIDFDQNGSIYPQPKSIFDHFEDDPFENMLHGKELVADFDRFVKEAGLKSSGDDNAS